jgi:hypothetical protein
MRLCDYTERLCGGGEHFELKIQVFEALAAVAVRERDPR